MTFFIHYPPVAKGRPRFTRTGRAYTPRKTREAERAYRLMISPHAPPEPLRGAVEIRLAFVMPKPKSYPRRLYGEPHVKKPDLDNLVKALKDAANGLLWRDDAQVSVLRATKRYQAEGEPTGVRVTVRELV